MLYPRPRGRAAVQRVPSRSRAKSDGRPARAPVTWSASYGGRGCLCARDEFGEKTEFLTRDGVGSGFETIAEYPRSIYEGALDLLIERGKHFLRGLPEYYLRTDNELDGRLARQIFETGHRAPGHVEECCPIGLRKAPLFAQGVQ